MQEQAVFLVLLATLGAGAPDQPVEQADRTIASIFVQAAPVVLRPAEGEQTFGANRQTGAPNPEALLQGSKTGPDVAPAWQTAALSLFGQLADQHLSLPGQPECFWFRPQLPSHFSK